jgi:glycolate oxidase subunit GlcD
MSTLQPSATSRALVRALRRIVGKANVIEAEAHRRIFGYDASPLWAMPDLVVLPTSAEQVTGIVRAADRFGVPFVARGAGTGLSGGSVPGRGGIVIALARLNRILEIDSENLRATVEPGVVNLDLQRELAPLGLRFAPDPASQRASTIGGNIAENAGGPHCLKYGVTTNHLLGLDVVMPRGDALFLGGAPDPPGYDLMGALTGSEGTMGVVTRAMVRLSRLPPAVRTTLATFESMEAAGRAVSDIIAARIVPAALEIMDRVFIEAVQASMDAGYPRDAEAVLIIELEGRPEGMDRASAQIERICRAAGATLLQTAAGEAERERLWAGRHASSGALGRLGATYLVSDAVVPRERLPEILRRVGEIGRQYGLVIGNVFHAGDGNLHPNIFYDRHDPEQVRRAQEASLEIMRACAAMGGTISGEHGIGLEKIEAMKFIFSPQDLSLMRDVKQVFDPKGLCNPGKVLPGEVEAGAAVAPAVPGAPDDLVRAVATMVGEGASSQAATGYALEGVEPGVVAQPGSAEEMVEIIRLARASRGAVVPVGGGTLLSVGHAPARYDVALSTARLNRVIEHDAGNLTVTVEAGVTLAALNDALAERSQMVALDPPLPGRATVGGIIAARASGPRRLLYGTPRDLTLGVQAVLGDGRIVRLGGKAVKNVAGYDLTKLFVGSWGTLGIIAQATLRTHPLPEAQSTLMGRFGSAREANAWSGAVLRSKLIPSRLEVLGGEAGEGGWVGLLQIEGLAEEVEGQVREAREAAPRLAELAAEDAEATWRRVGDLPVAWDGMVCKVCAPISRAVGVIEAAREFAGVVWHAGSGVAYLLARWEQVDAAWIDVVRQAAKRAGGQLMLERATNEMKQAKGVWGGEIPGLEIMRGLKRALDPDGVLSPGRFVGGI